MRCLLNPIARERVNRVLSVGLIIALIPLWSLCSRLSGSPSVPGQEGPQAPSPSSHAQAVSHAVGSPQQCTGLVDAAYPGRGTAHAGVWDHPFHAFEPSGEPHIVGTTRIGGGDTLIIASGSYRMGFGAPGAGSCDPRRRY